MKNVDKFSKKLITFKRRMFMIVPGETYWEIVAFINGINFAFDAEPLIGFTEWLREKFAFKGPFWWGQIVNDIFEEKKPEFGQTELDKINFLISSIEEYLRSVN